MPFRKVVELLLMLSLFGLCYGIFATQILPRIVDGMVQAM